jgi:hypothetical protein
MPDYPWYESVTGNDILQGDFLKNCPIIVPPQSIDIPASGEALDIEVGVNKYNVIVMSQSCDIQQGHVDLVLVCPYWPLEKLSEKNEYFKSSKGKEDLRRGNIPGYHLLNKCELEGLERDYIVADFRNVYSLPLEFLKTFAAKSTKRIRLLPPYREHLSQAFARFFMRVGLPVDIPSFTKPR